MRRAALAAVTALVLAGCRGGGDAPPRDQGAPAARAAAPAERWPQPLRYALELAYDARRFALTGSERIELRNSGPKPLTSVWLRTWGNAFGGCAQRFVRVTVTGGGRAGAERVGCTALEVRLAEPLARGARTTLDLAIEVTAPERPDRFGRYAGAAYFGNALPLLAVADADGWALPPYTFRGESFFSLAARWDVRLRLPPGVRAALTGTAASGRTTAVARDFAIVAGPMRMTEARAGDVRLRHWRLRESARDAARALRLARRALRTYAQWFGPYGRPELDIVEGPREVSRGAGLGMEYPELVLTPASPYVLEHEVAHQWWYGIVGNDEYTQPWLDESFATYAGLRLAGVAGSCRPPRGRPRLTASMKVFERAPRGDYSRVVYRGGACALRVLERGVGRARFDRLLQSIVRDHRDGIVTTQEFRAAVRAAAPPEVDADALLRRAGITLRPE
jgi:aminopeptidase N